MGGSKGICRQAAAGRAVEDDGHERQGGNAAFNWLYTVEFHLMPCWIFSLLCLMSHFCALLSCSTFRIEISLETGS